MNKLDIYKKSVCIQMYAREIVADVTVLLKAGQLCELSHLMKMYKQSYLV